MGIDLTKVALGLRARLLLGRVRRGHLAAKTTFINPPASLSWNRPWCLSMVVLGGMGSVLGVTIAAAYLGARARIPARVLEYRMLLFGAVMVIMMIYRPQGLISGEKRTYKITNKDKIDSSVGRRSCHGRPGMNTPVLEVTNLSKFRRPARAQRGGSHDQPAEIVALIGPNGAGNHVLQLHHQHLSAHRRTVQLHLPSGGKPASSTLNGMKPNEITSLIGMAAFQNIRLFRP